MSRLPKPNTDWEAIEREYRIGRDTTRQIGERHGVSHVAIITMAQRRGWTQDVQGLVRQVTAAKVLQSSVKRQIKANVTKITGSEVKKTVSRLTSGITNVTNQFLDRASEQVRDLMTTVNEAADIGCAVILRHQADIEQLRNESVKMAEELSFQREHLPELGKLLELMQDGAPADRRRELQEQFNRACALPARIGSLRALAEVQAKLQPLERKAHALDNDEPPAPAVREVSDDELRARANKFMGMVQESDGQDRPLTIDLDGADKA